MEISKETVWKEREENTLSEEHTMKKETKPEASKPKPRQTRSKTPSSSPTKPARKSKPLVKPFSEGKRKRGQTRVFIPIDDEETGFDETVKEVKAKATKVTINSKEKLFGKKSKPSKINEALKKGKLEVIPPMSLNEIVNEVVKNGNLKPLSELYGKFDESGKISLEEATIEYLNVYSKALIELMTVIPKSLYEILDARRQTTNKEDEGLKEHVLVNLCSVISKEEIDRLLKLEKNDFESKYRVNKYNDRKN